MYGAATRTLDEADTPITPVAFRVNSPAAIERLGSGDSRFELSARDLTEIPDQVRRGELSISGWIGEEMVFYAWVQFKARRLARSTLLPIGPARAFVYRALTVAPFRGRRIFSAALVFIRGWLGDRGYQRVFLDVEAANFASRKSIERAGFVFIGSYHVYRLLWMRWAVFPAHVRSAVSGPQVRSHQGRSPTIRRAHPPIDEAGATR